MPENLDDMGSLPSSLNEGAAASDKMTRYLDINTGQGGNTDEYTTGSTTDGTSDSRSAGAPQISMQFFPSPEALESAMWMSTEDSSSECFTSEVEDGSDGADGSECSSDSYSDDGYSDDGTANYMASMMHRSPPAAVPTSPGHLAATRGATQKMTMPPAFGAPEGLSFGGPEGLPFTLESLKRDLEKVGRVILSSNVGELAAERAQTLASINWLASHVPNAVLDKLGHEIKEALEDVDKGEDEDEEALSKEDRINLDHMTNVGGSDSMSEVSDLSQHDDASSFEDEEEPMELVEPAEVSNIQISYGDLAALAHTSASFFLPDEQVMCRNNGLLPEVANRGMLFIPTERKSYSMNSENNLDFLQPVDNRTMGMRQDSTQRMSASPPLQTGPLSSTYGSTVGSGMGILDLIPVKPTPPNHVGMHNVIPRDNIPQDVQDGGRGLSEMKRSRGATSISASSAHSSTMKGMKGLFRRFSRKGDHDSSTSPPPHERKQGSPIDCDGGLKYSKHEGQQCDETLFPSARTKRDTIRRNDQNLNVGSAVKTEIKQEHRVQNMRSLPYANKYRCALLFVDISGFTKLSRLLDPESLSKAINSYFQLIVDEVIDGKGDLLKFAGDAVFIEWKACRECNLEDCVESAVNCAAKIISRCADFSVLANGANKNSSYLVTSQAVQVDTLNVHCGIGAGQMVGVHVGDNKSRREYLLLGQPITQATIATDFATLGEVAISPEAHRILSRVCDFRRDAEFSDGETPTVVATRHEFKFSSRQKLGTHQPKIVNDISRGVTIHVEGLEVEALRKYRRMMTLYVHPVVVDNDLAAVGNFKSVKVKKVDRSDQEHQERHREEAEIRNVFTIFVKPLIETRISDDETVNLKMYSVLNDIMNLSSREIERFHGHLRQFIVDDKGLVMIITFGLRGTTIPNMVSQRALPATIAIHNTLKMELGIDSRIGATIGEAYCGVVGGVKRHEYAVLGPSVNLAARLMASKINPGILVDNHVRMMANRSYGFNALPPVVAKGYGEPVPIFEPLSPLERNWGKILPNFVGRKAEIMSIMKISTDLLSSHMPSRLVVVESKSGMGKSSMVAHAIEHVRRTMTPHKYRLVVIKSVSKESDSLVPFGVFRSILRKILLSFQKGSYSDDKSMKSRKSRLSAASALQRSFAWESLSGRSISQSTQNHSSEDSVEIFHLICQELKMKPTFVDYALTELLGVDLTDKEVKPCFQTLPSTEEMVTFLARAFRLCTRGSNLVVVALDDLHYADEFSWKVIQQLFMKETNILFVGAVNTSSIEDLRVDPEFWKELDEKFRAENRFVTMKLGHLNRDEITCMVMKTLGIRRKEVPDDVLDGVTIQSGGMPYFVNEILEKAKRQMLDDEDFELSDMTFESFADLVLQRLDSFDFNTRNVLNIGAVIGLSFTMDELVGVQIRTSEGTEEAVRQITKESLQAAVEEGILETRAICDDESDEGEVLKYAFCHAVWRTTLLTLMLEGRKRDLHRVIAETLEELDVGSNDYMFQTKLFKHWVCSGNFVKATKLALIVGKHFEERLGLPAQSIRIYNEALDLLRESGEEGPRKVSADALANITADDLVILIRVHVALGHALSIAQQMKMSVATYQDALRITQTAKAASELRDRSILFPVFSGLSTALKTGYIVQDGELKYEKAMLRRYMQETRLYDDPIYIMHALTLQADMYSRLGEFDTAIEAQRGVSQIYNVEFFSTDLCNQYGSDIAAECMARSALWHLQLDQMDEALSICRYVTREILSRLERRNVHAIFMVLYPILWVLVEGGCAREARDSFEMFVCQPFTEMPQGMSTFFLSLYDPILMLLDLHSNGDIDGAVIDDYVEWASETDNLTCSDPINMKTAEMGRSGNSIAAEVCYLLAQRTHNLTDRSRMVENGRKVATDDARLMREKGIALAGHCSLNLLNNLETLDAIRSEDR